MCPPVLLAAAVLTSAGASVYQARKADKARDAAAAEVKAEANREKTASDQDLRDERKTSYQKRSRSKTNYAAQPSTLFSPRSFFAG